MTVWSDEEGQAPIVVTTSSPSVLLPNLEYGMGYTVGVESTNAEGNESVTSQTFYETLRDNSVPPTPKNVVLLSGDKSLHVSWTNETYEDNGGYNVYVNGKKVNSSPIQTATYDVGNLTNGVLYSVQVTDVNRSGVESPKSLAQTVEAIEVPKNVVAHPSPNEITVTWNKSLEGDVVGYNIYQEHVGKLNKTPILGTSYTVQGLSPNTMYFFTVQAITKQGESAESNSATTVLQPAVPEAPSTFAVSFVSGNVLFRWSSAPNASTYTITANGTVIADQVNGTSYTTSALTPGGTYNFEIVANDAAGSSSPKSVWNVHIPVQPSYTLTKDAIHFNNKSVSSPSGFVYNHTTYMPIWYVMQAIKNAGLNSSWNGKEWDITAKSAILTNTQPGNRNMNIAINGRVVQNVSGISYEDPSTGKVTTYMPIWYVMQVLKRMNITSQWNGQLWNLYSH